MLSIPLSTITEKMACAVAGRMPGDDSANPNARQCGGPPIYVVNELAACILQVNTDSSIEACVACVRAAALSFPVRRHIIMSHFSIQRSEVRGQRTAHAYHKTKVSTPHASVHSA